MHKYMIKEMINRSLQQIFSTLNNTKSYRPLKLINYNIIINFLKDEDEMLN